MIRHGFLGSKRRAREVARVQHELKVISQLAIGIRDEAQLAAILAEVPGETDRAAVRTLIAPFLRFPRETARAE